VHFNSGTHSRAVKVFNGVCFSLTQFGHELGFCIAITFTAAFHNSHFVATFHGARVDTRFPVEIHIVVGRLSGIELDQDNVIGFRVICNATQVSDVRTPIVLVQGDSFLAIPSELPALGRVETHFGTVRTAIGVPHLM
jgi:hypothetical protein